MFVRQTNINPSLLSPLEGLLYNKMLKILYKPGKQFANTPHAPQGPAKKPNAGPNKATKTTGTKKEIKQHF